MKRTPKKAANKRETFGVDSAFGQIVKTLTHDRQVSCGKGKGFGSGALKVNGKIFAMISSKSEFVVKLPRGRVEELESAGVGKRFDPGHGRLMKEWMVVRAGKASWVKLAREACEFVKRKKP
ncbi:MAG TPA: hypothetical protein VKV79_06930 [Terriglobia bacterium]|nr:hypothetical protein [Terriglobia bacterium]